MKRNKITRILLSLSALCIVAVMATSCNKQEDTADQSGSEPTSSGSSKGAGTGSPVMERNAAAARATGNGAQPSAPVHQAAPVSAQQSAQQQ